MDLDLTFGSMVVLDIIKRINGSNHDFEPHLMEKLNISIGGSRDVKIMCNQLSKFFTSFLRPMKNQHTKFCPIVALDLLKMIDTSDHENGSHKSPKWYI